MFLKDPAMESDTTDLTSAEDEWSRVTEIVPEFANSRQIRVPAAPAPGAGRSAPSLETPLLKTETALDHFRSVCPREPHQERDQNLKSLAQDWLFCTLCSRPNLDESLQKDQILAFSLVKQPFDDSNKVHFQIILTIYKQLTGNVVDCPRYGSHWEQIGFQGNDPATDLRGMGCLALIQPLYLVMDPNILPFTRAVHKLSLDENQEFPMMVLIINLIRISFCAMKDGLINRFCNEEGDFWKGFNFFSAAVLFHYYTLWKTGRKTIKDSGYVLKDTEEFCRGNAHLVIQRLRNHLQTAYPREEIRKAQENITKRSVIKHF